MNKDHLEHWLAANPLSPIHVDCATTVMLKILDGKCKMKAAEKAVMALLYDGVKFLPGQLLDASVHTMIASARESCDEAMKNIIYEQRLLAETAISRPVMKGFKAMIRQTGLLADNRDNEES